jgi:alkanesulfonate monooxygenase
MPASTPAFGIAMRNFTAYPEMPDGPGLLDYAVRMEDLGYESLWVWDHILLGVEPNFPILESLSLLTAVAARTSRVRLGTGILVLALRNPVVLAKQLSTLDILSNGRLILGVASGWYKREFDAVGVPYEQRGKIVDQSLEILTRLWQEDRVTGDYPPHALRNAVMHPKPVQKPRPPILIGGYADRVLKRVATKGDGWLTYFYTPASFTKSWAKIRAFAEEAGRDPATLSATNQLPIMVGKSRDAVAGPLNDWLRKEWDYSEWSESSPDSAIMGTVEDCVAQLRAQLDAGVQRVIFVPYRYEMEQAEIIAKEIIPRLR